MEQEKRKPYAKMTVDKFWDLEETDKYRYIQDRLNLNHYARCSGEDVNDGGRLIGLVRREYTNNNYQYYIYPIDCLDPDLEGCSLFNGTGGRGRVPLLQRESWGKKNIKVAKSVFEEDSANSQGQKMVSANYFFKERTPQNTYSPLRVEDIRVLDYSPADMFKRIKDLRTEANTLTDGITQLEQEKKKLEEDLETRRQELEQERQKLEAEQEEQRVQLAALRDEQGRERYALQELYNQSEQLQADQKRAQDGLCKLEATALAFAERLRAFDLEADLDALGLSSQPAEQPKKNRDELTAPLPELAVQVRDAIARGEKKLYYKEHIVRAFLGAMFTNQIIILSGPPGTGKSSLPPAIAAAIGAECRMVSVQPSWTDNQDLLGFYDPTRERFAATPFLDILVEAKNHSDTIYLVCLDEMNLVRVEYYFSEILSAMEMEKKELRLYSPYAHETQLSKLNWQLGALSKLEPSLETKEKLRDTHDKLRLLDRYQATFSLPDNVQFVGTLNEDETTKGLSPKVLDRSFIIKIDRTEPPAQGGAQSEDTAPATPVGSFTPDAFRNSCRLTGKELAALDTELKDRVNNLNERLKKQPGAQASASLSARGLAHAKELFRRGLSLEDVYQGKVLSALRYSFGPELDQII